MQDSIIGSIKDAGIVGAGGAGFPTHVKLGSKVDTIIVNGAECEPMIHADKQIMLNYFDRVYGGIKAAAAVTGAARVVFSLKGKYSEEIKVIENFISSLPAETGSFKFEIFKLGNFYPAGDEQVLVYEITGKIVPEGGIPLMKGIVVINVETLLNISNALNDPECGSVTEKFVTVNGEVFKPMTLKVPVGTPAKTLIEYCGGIKISDYSVIDGGPMMGKIIDEKEYAVKKTTKSIIVLPADNIAVEHKLRTVSSAVKRAQAICLSCRMCTDLCPRYLLGHQLLPDDMMKKMYKGRLEQSDIEKFGYAYLCCDCGLCELYSCVVDLSARSLFNYIKSELAKKGIENSHKRTQVNANEFRDYRKVPVQRLEKRLETDKYESRAPLADFTQEVSEVKLYLCQHVGAPAVPIVKLSQQVKRGEAVADIPEGKLGARVHSPISGTVEVIDNSFIIIKKKAV